MSQNNYFLITTFVSILSLYFNLLFFRAINPINKVISPGINNGFIMNIFNEAGNIDLEDILGRTKFLYLMTNSNTEPRLKTRKRRPKYISRLLLLRDLIGRERYALKESKQTKMPDTSIMMVKIKLITQYPQVIPIRVSPTGCTRKIKVLSPLKASQIIHNPLITPNIIPIIAINLFIF